MFRMDRGISEGESSAHRETGKRYFGNLFKKFSRTTVDFVIPISPRIGIHRSPIITMPRQADH